MTKLYYRYYKIGFKPTTIKIPHSDLLEILFKPFSLQYLKYGTFEFAFEGDLDADLVEKSYQLVMYESEIPKGMKFLKTFTTNLGTIFLYEVLQAKISKTPKKKPASKTIKKTNPKTLNL